MVNAYLNNGAVALPKIKAHSIDWDLLADEARTADGTERRDVLARKRVWRLDLILLTKAEYDAIINHLEAVGWGATTFWNDEMSGTAAANSIAVYVSIAKDEGVQFRSPSGWESHGRNLNLIISEK